MLTTKGQGAGRGEVLHVQGPDSLSPDFLGLSDGVRAQGVSSVQGLPELVVVSPITLMASLLFCSA